MTVALERMSLADCTASAETALRRARRAIARDHRAATAGRGRSFQSPYEGARFTRLEADWISALQSADMEVKKDAHKLRNRARDIRRNNPLGKQYCRLVDLNVVGAMGPMHEPRIRDNSGKLSTRLNSLVKDQFAEWCERVSLDREHDWVALQRQLAPSTRCDGEGLLRFWTGPEFDDQDGLAIEPIDPDQLDHTYNQAPDNNGVEIVMGVQRDPLGRRQGYWLWNEPYDSLRARKREFVPANQVRHLYDPDRVNQSRGITDFHSVMLAIHFAGSYSEYEMIASRSNAARPVIWKRIAGDLLGDVSSRNTPSNEKHRVIEQLEPGQFGFAPEGYEPANVHIDHPSTAFESFMRDQKRDIATGLGVGYASLTADLSQTSFSSARTGTLLERDTWRSMQAWWIREFVREVYREWLKQALLLGGATAGRRGLTLDQRDFRRLSAASFTPRGWDYVNPAQDRASSVTGVENGLTSRHRETRESGISLEEIFDELEMEKEMAEERGITISNPQLLLGLARLAAAEAAGSNDNAPEEDVAGIVPADQQKPSGRAHTNGNGPVARNRIAAALRSQGGD